jgi:hypothetical protein
MHRADFDQPLKHLLNAEEKNFLYIFPVSVVWQDTTIHIERSTPIFNYALHKINEPG